MISVILPAYKAQFLSKAIDSILAQTYHDFELVIVNDASPEHLHEIVSTYKDSRIKYYENPRNIGGKNLVENWNHCIKYASGDFIVLASDDDIYNPRYLEKMMHLADKYPAVDVFHCRVCVIDENGQPIYLSPSIAEYETDIDFIYQRAVNRRTQVMPDFMLRRSALEKIGGYVDYPKAWYSDEMTVYRLALGKGAACSSDVLFNWRSSRLNISSLTSNVKEKATSAVMYMKDVTRLMESTTPADEYMAFLKKTFPEACRHAVARQIISEIALAPRTQRKACLKILSQYPGLLTKKDRYLLAITSLRHLLHI